MNDHFKTMLIGLFVMAACAVTVGLILFIEPKVGDGKQVLHVMMANVQNINPGTRVLLAGYPIGDVSGIERINNPDPRLLDQQAHPYMFILTLKVDSKVPIYDNYTFGIGTFGLLGEKIVNIQPVIPQPGKKIHQLGNNDVVYGTSEDMIESAFNELSEVAQKAGRAIDLVSEWIEAHGQEIADAINAFGSAMDEFKEFLASINESTIVGDIETISHQIACGEGTLGSLIMKDQVYMQISTLLARANTLMSDLNNYGLLFQNNTRWKKLRAAQVAKINDLQSPDDYIRYFQSQLDTINSALGRLDQTFEKMQDSPDLAQDGYIKAWRAFSMDVSSLCESVDLLQKSLEENTRSSFCPSCPESQIQPAKPSPCCK